MIATFSLVTVDSCVYLKSLLDALNIDWGKAILMMNGKNGGIGSGMNIGTSASYVLLSAIAGQDISKQTLFAP